MTFRWPLLVGLVSAVLLCLAPGAAMARVRLENICTIQGQQEVRLVGVGLVVGLPGTGDGNRETETIRAMKAAMRKLHQPGDIKELRDANNIALVLVEAKIPRTGLRRGQKIDCFVSSTNGAKKLTGGRLLTTPLTTVDARNELVVAEAGGWLQVEDPARPTAGKITLGADLREDVTALFLSELKTPMITLLIDPDHASFWTASEIARSLNSEFSFEARRPVAKAVGPATVEVEIPRSYQDTPVEFVAQVLDSGIDVPHTQARVILNARTETVIVTGEAAISPCIISHKSLNIEIGADANDTPGGNFVLLTEQDSRQPPQQLRQLLDAFNQLRVPTKDVISIIRELHATGKLHAELIDK